MKLACIGATGRTGAHVVDLALAHGHEVTAIVRSPDKLTPRPRLQIVKADPADATALAAALRDHDAVVSTLGLPPGEALRPSTRMTEWATALVHAMDAAAVPRLTILSAAVLFPERGLLFSFFRWFLRHHARDLVTMEEVVRTSALAWTIVRPPRLVDRPEEECRLVEEALPPGGMTASFRAVAASMLACVEQGTHLRHVVGLAR